MTVGTARRLSSRTRVLVAAAAVAASVVLPVGAADAVEDTATGSRWTEHDFPDSAVSLTGATEAGPAATWVTGVAITRDGRTTRFDPVVYAKDNPGDGPWRKIPTAPGVTGRSNAIAATSAADALLVGDQQSRTLGSGIMTQHWDGSSWAVVEAPTAPAAMGGGLLSLSAVSPTDVWAAGWLQIQDAAIPDPDGGPTRIVNHEEGLVEHWDGRAWTRVPLPRPYASWVLNSVSASGSNDVWAVGNGLGADDRPLVLHYDGTAWTVMPTPPFAGLYGEFNGVVANSPDDVWAVGRTVLDENDEGHALVMHWNGTSWTQAATPADAGPMQSVAAAGTGAVAVGMTADRSQGYVLRASGRQTWRVGLPTDLPDGRKPVPTSVNVDPRTGKATVVGALVDPAAGLPAPMALSGRV